MPCKCILKEQKHGQRHTASETHTVVEGGTASILFTVTGATWLCRAA